MRYTNLIKAAIIILLAIHSEVTLAGAPFVTDDPEPVELHRLEVNYAISKTWRDNSYSASFPSVDFNYGYSTNLQLHAQPKIAFERDGSDRNYGLDNLEIGAKCRFFNTGQEGSEFMLGVYPMLQLPSGDTRLGGGRGKTQLFLPVWGQYNTEDWILYGGVGYRINNGGADDKNSWFFGTTALYQIATKLKIGGEIYRETATAIGEKSTSGFNIGSIYDINETYHLLFSAGRALNNVSATNQLSMFMALQVIY